MFDDIKKSIRDHRLKMLCKRCANRIISSRGFGDIFPSEIPGHPGYAYVSRPWAGPGTLEMALYKIRRHTIERMAYQIDKAIDTEIITNLKGAKYAFIGHRKH
jgi:hypothetical protein